MPLVRIALGPGRPPLERRKIADAVHEALVETARVPTDDRFQLLQEVEAEDLIFDPAYLGHQRTPAVVFIQVFLNVGRSVEVKKAFYGALAQKLEAAVGLRPDDLLVNLVEVPRENWSFGGGRMSYPPEG